MLATSSEEPRVSIHARRSPSALKAHRRLNAQGVGLRAELRASGAYILDTFGARSPILSSRKACGAGVIRLGVHTAEPSKQGAGMALYTYF